MEGDPLRLCTRPGEDIMQLGQVERVPVRHTETCAHIALSRIAPTFAPGLTARATASAQGLSARGGSTVLGPRSREVP